MRILVVEDEHRIAQSLKKGLTQERFAVDVAYTGTDGYDLLASETYDCIILDRMLPETDGITLLTKLRKEKIHTPVLFLTAKGLTENKVEGLNAGADDYLAKPFAFEELLARVRALVRRPKTTLPTILSVSDLTLDTTSLRVLRSEKVIQLSQKEFSLLEYLLRHPNTILTKEQIIAHVWDYDADILPNTVEVYMKNLRKKIENPFPTLPSIIETVRGFGYKITK